MPALGPALPHVRHVAILPCKLRYGAGKHIWKLLVTSLSQLGLDIQSLEQMYMDKLEKSKMEACSVQEYIQ